MSDLARIGYCINGTLCARDIKNTLGQIDPRAISITPYDDYDDRANIGGNIIGTPIVLVKLKYRRFYLKYS